MAKLLRSGTSMWEARVRFLVLLAFQYIDNVNLGLGDQIGTVELGLAQDIETLKGNVEQLVSDTGNKHSTLEQKLQDFTIELDIENGRLRMDVDVMRHMVDKLHQKNLALDLITSDCNRRFENCQIQVRELRILCHKNPVILHLVIVKLICPIVKIYTCSVTPQGRSSYRE